MQIGNIKAHNFHDCPLPTKLNVCNLPATYSAMKPKLANATKKQIDFSIYKQTDSTCNLYSLTYKRNDHLGMISFHLL